MTNLPTHAGDARLAKLAAAQAMPGTAAQYGDPGLTRPPITSVGVAGVPAPAAEPARAGEGVAAVPEWIELLPAGEFLGRDGRGPFRLSDPSAVIAASLAAALRAGIPIDYDHATDFAAPLGAPAPAAGWITELAVRGGALWGRVEWTPRARAAIRAREYRYISPVFEYSRNGRAIRRLLRAGLTNNPNLYLTAICAAGDEDNAMDELLERLRELLGLPAAADADAVVAAIAKLKSAEVAHDATAAASARPDPARYVDVAQFEHALTELNTMRAERARERAERAVDEAMRAGKIVPAQREWAIAYSIGDPAGFESFAKRQPALFANGAPAIDGAPGRANAAGLRGMTRTESAICAQLGLKPEQFLGRKLMGHDFLSLNRFEGNEE